MKKKSSVMTLLVFVIVFALLAAGCQPTEPSKTSGSADTSKTDATAPASTQEKEATLKVSEGVDFGDGDFNILVPKSAGWSIYGDFTPTEGNTGNAIDDANYTRKEKLHDLYKVNITETISSAGVAADARADISSNNGSYDAIHIELSTVASLAQEGLFVDLASLDSMELSNPWYNQSFVDQLSISGKLFFVIGDISTVDNDGIAAIMFNKEMVADNSELTSPYDHIKNNTWTIDTMYNMCKGVYKDLNDDGKATGKDQWGYLAAYSSFSGQLNSCGFHICEKDENDVPVLSAYSTKNLEIIDKVLEFYSDNTTTLHLDQIPSSECGGVSVYEYGNTIFIENRVMFRQTAMTRIIQCRQMENDFGILPYPKYDSEQEDYAHSFSYSSPVIAIPRYSDDAEAAGAVLEALSYYGRTIVLPQYYDRVLKGNVARDEESRFCLDIIFDTAYYDIGVVLDIGDIDAKLWAMVPKGTNTFASDYAAVEASAKAQLQKYIDDYDNIFE